ncbi:MAG: ribonuclease HII [Firmicutes bacterium]|nr:ribonuclease HII [Bacillota bacterium]
MTELSSKIIKLNWQERMELEQDCWRKGYQRVSGLDEAGRGPLAGPVVAAIFVITPEFNNTEVNDSKRITPLRREKLYNFLTSGQWEYGVGVVEPAEIDRINIYQASRVAMFKALQSLQSAPDYLLVDALVVPETTIEQKAIIHGDSLSVAIAAASIIAKHTRDQLMIRYDLEYPGYGFAKHKGYPTLEHYNALERLGPSPIHRRSFRLVKR